MSAHAPRLLSREVPMRALALWLALASGLTSADAMADDPSREACVESHGAGQDAREQGKLTLARGLFVACAQPGCPELVQVDCARFADELARSQPSLTFVARDSDGRDLPDTAVYLDGALVATDLSDGRAHDVDPGRHELRFAHDGREQLVTVVAASGEKGRMVLASFEAVVEPRPTAEPPKPAPRPRRRRMATTVRALLASGGALLLGGAVAGLTGLARVPDRCSLASHECAAAPGDPVFDDASRAVRLGNVGLSIAAAGAAVLAAGAAWQLAARRAEQRAPQRGAQQMVPSIAMRPSE